MLDTSPDHDSDIRVAPGHHPHASAAMNEMPTFTFKKTNLGRQQTETPGIPRRPSNLALEPQVFSLG
jgi:hypothetical protein